MNKEELKQFRETLLEQRATLLKAQETSRDNGLNPSFSDIEQEGGGHAFHMADLGTDNMNREQQYMLAARANRALKTIQQNQYVHAFLIIEDVSPV